MDLDAVTRTDMDGNEDDCIAHFNLPMKIHTGAERNAFPCFARGRTSCIALFVLVEEDRQPT